MAPGSVVLHTEASRGFGGQEIRILAESRWLATHGWRALIAAVSVLAAGCGGSPVSHDAATTGQHRAATDVI